MADDKSESILKFENVSVVFDELPALNDVSFELCAGETRIVFGAAGSGKSLMLKVALGLLRPTSGRVFLFGEDVTNMDEEHLFVMRGRIGVLFQEGGLFDSMNIEENVAYPLMNQKVAHMNKVETVKKEQKKDVPARVREALRFVELEHTLEKFPSELSGGMRRRVGIARAAVTNPDLMLYDSPTAGLDPITANTIMALIVKARDTRNTTSVIVTHRYQDGHIMANFRYNPDSAQIEAATSEANGLAARTRFMVFGQGKLVFVGTQQELDDSEDPYISKFRSVKS